MHIAQEAFVLHLKPITYSLVDDFINLKFHPCINIKHKQQACCPANTETFHKKSKEIRILKQK